MRAWLRFLVFSLALCPLFSCGGSKPVKDVAPSQTASPAPEAPAKPEAALPESSPETPANLAASAPAQAAPETPAAETAQAGPAASPASAEKAETPTAPPAVKAEGPATAPETPAPRAAAPTQAQEVQAAPARLPDVGADRPQGQLTSATPENAPEAAAPRPGGKHIAVVGDSLAVGVGQTMVKRLSDYQDVAVTAMGKVSTGLIAKKFYDWEGALEALVRERRPDALVVVMGGNDSNNNIGGKEAGSPAWKEAYAEKVASFLRIAADAGVMVYWAGLPIMRDEGYSKRVQAANEAAQTACGAVSNCVYIDSWAMFADESGHYAPKRDLGGGKDVALRAGDGVHLTVTGYDYLCRKILDQLSRNVSLLPKRGE